MARDLYYKKYGGFDYYDDLKKASCYNKLTGCGGVLYPPRCLHGDVFLEEVFMKLAPTSDDIWFWLMGVRNKTKVCVPPGHLAKLHEINGTQDQGLSAINDHGEKLFFVHLNSMLTYYPDILPIMNSDRKENEALIRSLKGNLPRRLRGLAKKVSPGNLLKHLKRYRG
ncbi:MAG: hypothetical protein LBQ61_03335 [Spirochaetales bacterium]|nr:hypothetical protein [Spirochaetales bacterium]